MSPTDPSLPPEGDTLPPGSASRQPTTEEAMPTVFMSPAQAAAPEVRDETATKTVIEQAPAGTVLNPSLASRTSRTGYGSSPDMRGTKALSPEVLAALQDPARAIGRYAVLGELGRGGMGVVYRAYDTSLRRNVALKMILDPTRAGPEQVARFQVEASAAGRLRHPGIVAVYEVSEHEGKPYLVMELIDGSSFETLLKKGGLEPRRVAEIMRDVAFALDHAHKSGIVHRDVKPENILIDKEGKPHLMDFGLARESGSAERLTVTGAVLGTPAYMSPEQAAGDPEHQGPHSDVYGLGAVLYRALTGHPPFKGDTLNKLLRQIITEEAAPLRAEVPSLAPDLETITLRCIEKEPERRYPSAEAVAQELDRFVKGEPILARPVGTIERTGLWFKRNRKLATWLVVAFLVLSGLTAATLYFFLRERKDERELVDKEKKLEEELKRNEAAQKDRLVAQERFRDGETKRKAGDWDGAILEYDKALALDAQNQLAVLQRGMCKLQKRDYEAARKDFDRAIELDPKNAYGWKDRADARQHLNEVPGAFEDYAKALELDPKYALAYHDRGMLYRAQGQDDKALQDFVSAAKLDPKNAKLYFWSGFLKAKRGDDGGAIDEYTKAIDLDPQYAEAYHNRACVYLKRNDADKAIQDCTTALKFKPSLAFALRDRGFAYQKKKEPKLALADFEAYLKTTPRPLDSGDIEKIVEKLKKS